MSFVPDLRKRALGRRRLFGWRRCAVLPLQRGAQQSLGRLRRRFFRDRLFLLRGGDFSFRGLLCFPLGEEFAQVLLGGLVALESDEIPEVVWRKGRFDLRLALGVLVRVNLAGEVCGIEAEADEQLGAGRRHLEQAVELRVLPASGDRLPEVLLRDDGLLLDFGCRLFFRVQDMCFIGHAWLLYHVLVLPFS